jgi:hypothetical protein
VNDKQRSYGSVSKLVGLTMAEVVVDDENNEIRFTSTCGRKFCMFPQQVCSYVSIEDVCGDPQWLVGSPILAAEESTNVDEDEDQQWTFYRITTFKGTVVMRWSGESNDYYSTAVDFYEEVIPSSRPPVDQQVAVPASPPERTAANDPTLRGLEDLYRGMIY